ncbi:MAG: hypothetical protein AAGG46_04710, partial [Planctomycetota bacterium]
REEWQAKSERMNASAAKLSSRIQSLDTDLQHAKQNPLRAANTMRTAAGEVSVLTEEIATLRRDLQTLPSEAAGSRDRLAEALATDEAALREAVDLGGLDAGELSRYLLGESLAEPLSQFVETVRHVRALLPTNGSGDSAPPARGVNVIFPGVRPLPDFLAKEIVFAGAAQILSQPFDFEGRITGLTSSPKRHGEPMLLELASTSEAPMRLDATFDRTGVTAVDTFALRCPRLLLPSGVVGSDGRLRFQYEPQIAAVSADLTVEGDSIRGSLNVGHDQITLSTPPTTAAGPLAKSFGPNPISKHFTLGDVVVTVKISGNLASPTCVLESNLGTQVAAKLRRSIRDSIDDRATEVLAECRLDVESEIAACNARVARLTESVTRKLDEQAGVVRQLAAATNFGGSLGSLPGFGSHTPPTRR